MKSAVIPVMKTGHMKTGGSVRSFQTERLRSGNNERSRVWKPRCAGFTLMETLGVIALTLLVSGISVWTYQSLANRQKQYPLTEERVHRLRDQLVTAHLRAQQGQVQEIPLADSGLCIEGAPSTLMFLPPYGKLGLARPVRFWAGGQQSWWQFDIALDGMVVCQPGNRPVESIGETSTSHAPLSGSEEETAGGHLPLSGDVR